MNLSSSLPSGLIGPQGPTVRVDTYTDTSITHRWSKPHTAKSVVIICYGAGGGGGGGLGRSENLQRQGGGGGGGGACTKLFYEADALPSSLFVTVGKAGTGGNGGSNSNGFNGGTGGNTLVASTNTEPQLDKIFAFAGGGGAGKGAILSEPMVGGGGGGTAGAGVIGSGYAYSVLGGLPATNTAVIYNISGGGRGAGQDPCGTSDWGGGGGGGARQDLPSHSTGGGSLYGGGGGGCGGWINQTASDRRSGTCGGANGRYLASDTSQSSLGGGAPGAAGNPTGANGSAGANASDGYACGCGGGGGGGGTTTGGSGGAGGFPSGGGGGGAPGSSTGGSGGAGGDGKCVIITFF